MPAARRWIAFALLTATQFVLILDASIVTVALPSMAVDLEFAPEDLSWVVNAYTLTFGGLLLLGGRMADLLGRRRMFMIGLVLFTVASAVGGLAQSSLWLILARAVQGIGAAIISPAALSIVLVLFTDRAERNKAVGLWGAVAGLGAAAGSILGGGLTEWFGWEAVMWVNVPVAAVAVALAPRLIPAAADAATGHRTFDAAGALTVTAGLAIGVYAIVDAAEAGWGSAQTLVLGAVSVALLALFVLIEARTSQPLMPLRVFRRPAIRGANIVAIGMTGAVLPMFFFMTLYLQDVLDMGPIAAGFACLPVALTFMVGGAVAGRVVTRLGYRVPVVVGLLVAAVGLAWFSRLRPDGTFVVDVLGPTVVVAIGAVTAFVAGTIAATSDSPESEAGLASGLINTTQQIGGAIGLAVLSTVAATVGASATDVNPSLDTLVEGYSAALVGAAVIAAAVAVLAAILLPKVRRGQSEQDDAEAREPMRVGA